MLERFRLKISEMKDMLELKSNKRMELREINKEKTFEDERSKLDNQIELETRKAEIRKLKAKNPEAKQQNNSGFAGSFDKFRDFATDFSKNQQSIVGDMNLGFGGENGKNKKSGKGSRARRSNFL